MFDSAELKALFLKFLILIGSVELVIFFLCWLYQLGLNEFDRYGNVDIPFPWKTFFLLAFLIPVGITFLLGLFITAFNNYMRTADESIVPPGEDKKIRHRLVMWWGIFSQAPFLVMLLLLGIVAGMIYKLDAIISLIGSLGAAALTYIILVAAAGLTVMTLLGLIWMVMTYRLKKKSMEYYYKREVMERLGVVFLDDRTLVDADGTTISTDAADVVDSEIDSIEEWEHEKTK